MVYYGYVDESGTQYEQQIMTVSLVLFHGKRAASRIHARIIKEQSLELSLNHRTLSKQKLHFVDLSENAQGYCDFIST